MQLGSVIPAMRRLFPANEKGGGWIEKKKNQCRVVPRVCAQALSLSLYLYLSLVGRFGDSSEAVVIVVVVVVVVVVVRQ